MSEPKSGLGVTPKMVEAGVEEARSWDREGGDLSALVRFVYGAMRPLEPISTGGWQPIETAPRDGVWILVWSHDFHVTRGTTQRCAVARYAGVYSGSIDLSMLLVWEEWGAGFEIRATHWMSLPGAPNGERQ